MAKDPKPLAPPTPPAPTPPAPPATETPAAEEVPHYKRCPLCFGGQGGVGNVYSTQGQTRYLKCKACSHTWSARVTAETTTIHHRKVETEKRI